MAGPPPVPPLDAAFVWALARLDGAAYAADCVATFGVPLPVGTGGTAASAAATAHGWVGNATEPAVVTARLQWSPGTGGTRAQELPSPSPILFRETLDCPLHHKLL